MPSPQRESPQDFFDRLEEHQRPHLLRLREISLEHDVAEALHWNTPAYLADTQRQWMLQAFAKHCSLRFTPGVLRAVAGRGRRVRRALRRWLPQAALRQADPRGAVPSADPGQARRALSRHSR